MTLRSLVVITALGCSGPAATAPTTVAAETKPAPEEQRVATPAEPPPAPPVVVAAPPPLTEEELKTDVPSRPAKTSPQSQLAIAAKANEEGAKLMAAGNYAEASAKFRDAYVRVPHGAYLMNLCRSQYQEGKLVDARTACRMVLNLSAGAELDGKATAMVQRIEAEAKAQNLVLP